MKRLLLLRHGKSDWNNPDQPDKGRPLNDRGQRAAALMGAYLRQRGLTPDLILSSPAVRTSETAQRVLIALQSDVPLTFRPELYLADPETVMEVVRGAPDDVATLLVIGHNPGMQLAALKLSAGDPAGRRDDIEDKFPTAALAVIEFDIKSWAAAKSGDLVAFDSPKALV
ncbi:histidine phosphatase family protein [Emcibacter sp. SYSU 3D8]|uniref:SixA phosphatase family protein n=1 Tax=Emcibacter sp. SYSU 3D8 TaxID=3133969 RepID=UPI0031FF19AF